MCHRFPVSICSRICSGMCDDDASRVLSGLFRDSPELNPLVRTNACWFVGSKEVENASLWPSHRAQNPRPTSLRDNLLIVVRCATHWVWLFALPGNSWSAPPIGGPRVRRCGFHPPSVQCRVFSFGFRTLRMEAECFRRWRSHTRPIHVLSPICTFISSKR